MRSPWLVVLSLVFLCACGSSASDTWPDFVVQRASLDMYPVLTDEIATNGNCTLREAIRSCALRAAVDACPAAVAPPGVNTLYLPAGTFSAALSGAGEEAGLTGDMDVGCNLIVQGAGEDDTIIDMNGLDRAFHSSWVFQLELHDLTIIDGCANGGTCTATAGTTIPAGGGVYHASQGKFRMENVTITESSAQIGGGLAICAEASSFDVLVDESHIHHNTATLGGGGVDIHVIWELRNSIVEDNTVTLSTGLGGGIRQWNRLATLTDSIIRNNTSAGAGGGLAIVGRNGGRGQLEAFGGTINDNIAGAHGGNVFVNAITGGTNLYSSACATGGCTASFDDTLIYDGVADSPTSSPNGSGGNLYANPSSSTPGQIELEGDADVSGGVDSTTPSAPDCEGSVHLYDTSNVANTSGCSITDHRPTGPVCGNSVLEMGEDCEGTVCCVSCVFATLGASCSDGDACTVGDGCDGAGSCDPGMTSPCGDGTVQSACGEECDDGDTDSSDGCSSSCQAEVCTNWE